MIVADRLRRNRKITITTRQTVIISVRCTSLTDARMLCERSYSVEISTEAGSDSRNAGSSFLMLSTTSTVLVPGCRSIASTTARLPPARDLVALHAVDRVADIAQPPRRAVAIRHDQRPVRRRIEELPVGLHRE